MQRAFEEIIKNLKQMECPNCSYHCADANICGHECAMKEAIEIVNQVASEYGGGWIPVSSGKLPEDGVDVLVWFEYFRFGEYNRLFQTTGISYTYNGKWSGFVNGSSGWRELNVIAWKPIEPYKAESE